MVVDDYCSRSRSTTLWIWAAVLTPTGISRWPVNNQQSTINNSYLRIFAMYSHLSIQTHKPNEVAIQFFIRTIFSWRFWSTYEEVTPYLTRWDFFPEIRVHLEVYHYDNYDNYIRERKVSAQIHYWACDYLRPLHLLCSHSRRTTSQSWLSCPGIFGNWVTSLYPTCVIFEIPVKLYFVFYLGLE